MSKKNDKDVQAALDALERKLTDTIGAVCASVVERMRELIGGVQQSLENKIEDLKQMVQTTNKTQVVEDKTDQLEQKVTVEAKKHKELVLKMECQATELFLRIRGAPEQRGTSEEKWQQIMEATAEDLGRSLEEIQYQVDKI